MKLTSVSQEVFACYSRSCAPPPVGKGGSGGGRGGSARRAAKAFVDETKREIKRDKGPTGAAAAAKTLTAKYGGRSSGTKGSAQISAKKAPSRVSVAAKAAANRWSRGETRTTKDAARALTAKYGSRR